MHALEGNNVSTAQCEELCPIDLNEADCLANCAKYSQLYVEHISNLFVIEGENIQEALDKFRTGCVDTDATQFMAILESINYRDYLEQHGVTGCQTLWKSQGSRSGDQGNEWLPYGIEQDASTYKETFTEAICYGNDLGALAQKYCPVTCGVEACTGDPLNGCRVFEDPSKTFFTFQGGECHKASECHEGTAGIYCKCPIGNDWSGDAYTVDNELGCRKEVSWTMQTGTFMLLNNTSQTSSTNIHYRLLINAQLCDKLHVNVET